MARKEYDGSGFLTFFQQMAVNNPCYQKMGNRTKTTHLIIHSTGANNANLKRYVTPDDGYLGNNPYNNGWNNPNSSTLVHGVIGLNKNGAVEVYQIAPWDKLVWGCGSGKNGSGNSFAIQVEICEDQTLGASYAREAYKAAVKLFAHLCKVYRIPAENIWSHNEAHAKGYASGHIDPEHWWKKVAPGLTMDGFRTDVKKLLNGEQEEIMERYEDVSKNDWYYDAVEKVSEAGMMQGSDGKFRPNDTVTRAEMATILSRLLER